MVKVELPDSVTLVGRRVATKPVGVVVPSVTVLVNPFKAATVTVDVPEPPCTVLTGEVAVMLKSGAGVTVTLTAAECDSEALAPVTVTV